jgi:hypothetical protein
MYPTTPAVNYSVPQAEHGRQAFLFFAGHVKVEKLCGSTDDGVDQLRAAQLFFCRWQRSQIMDELPNMLVRFGLPECGHAGQSNPIFCDPKSSRSE